MTCCCAPAKAPRWTEFARSPRSWSDGSGKAPSGVFFRAGIPGTSGRSVRFKVYCSSRLMDALNFRAIPGGLGHFRLTGLYGPYTRSGRRPGRITYFYSRSWQPMRTCNTQGRRPNIANRILFLFPRTRQMEIDSLSMYV